MSSDVSSYGDEESFSIPSGSSSFSSEGAVMMVGRELLVNNKGDDTISAD